jgi:phytoene dehydrogenase-like protein
MDKREICVVGAGITGATIARRCADAGYNVTVFESQPMVGGCVLIHLRGFNIMDPISSTQVMKLL